MTSSLRRYRPRPAARVRLLCFPHAGGGASGYRAWAALLPPTVELVVVQYPGREDRFDDPAPTDLVSLAGHVAAELRPLLDRPFAMFGHSMGTLVAYETLQRLRWEGAREPDLLVVSGRPAPDEALGGQLHLGDDEGLCDELARLGGATQEMFADPEIRRVFLPYIRDDYRLVETYRPRAAEPLDCPVTVFVGTSDPECDAAAAAGWARFTRGPLAVRSFPGDHFYLVPGRARVVAEISALLDPALARSSAAWPSMP